MKEPVITPIWTARDCVVWSFQIGTTSLFLIEPHPYKVVYKCLWGPDNQTHKHNDIGGFMHHPLSVPCEPRARIVTLPGVLVHLKNLHGIVYAPWCITLKVLVVHNAANGAQMWRSTRVLVHLRANFWPIQNFLKRNDGN